MADKPSENEEKYFRELELRQRMELLEKKQRLLAETEARELKELHWMHCPKCGQKLHTENYGKVEVDVCPGCKGLWLDANELETILATAVRGGRFQSFLKILGRP